MPQRINLINTLPQSPVPARLYNPIQSTAVEPLTIQEASYEHSVVSSSILYGLDYELEFETTPNPQAFEHSSMSPLTGDPDELVNFDLQCPWESSFPRSNVSVSRTPGAIQPPLAQLEPVLDQPKSWALSNSNHAVEKLRSRQTSIVLTESCILPMHLMKSALQIKPIYSHFKDRFRYRQFWHFWGNQESNRIKGQAWLQDRVDDLLYSLYSASQHSIRDRLQCRAGSCQMLDNKAQGENFELSVQDSSAVHSLDIRGHCSLTTAGGTLILQTARPFQKPICSKSRQSVTELQVHFFPNLDICSTAVSLTFPDIWQSIPPLLKISRMVPWDSKIIRYVSDGNIQGVRDLFESKEASPQDVDPDGYSLLDVSVC